MFNPQFQTSERFRAIITIQTPHASGVNITFISSTKILHILCEQNYDIEQILFTTVGSQTQPEIFVNDRIFESGDYTFWIRPKIAGKQFTSLIFTVEPSPISNFAISQMLIKQIKAFGYQPSHVYELDRRSSAETIPFYRKTRQEIEKLSEQLTISTNKILDCSEGRKADHKVEGNFGTAIHDIIDPNEEIIKRLDNIKQSQINEEQLRKALSEQQSKKTFSEDQLRKILSDSKSESFSVDQLRQILSESKSDSFSESQLRKVLSESKSDSLSEIQLRKVLSDFVSQSLTEEQLHKALSDFVSKSLSEEQLHKALSETKTDGLSEEELRIILSESISSSEQQLKSAISELKQERLSEQQLKSILSETSPVSQLKSIITDNNKELISSTMSIVDIQTNKLLREISTKIPAPVKVDETEFYKKKLTEAEVYILKLQSNIRN